MPHLPNEAASDVWSIPHERAATKQTARQAAAHAGFDAHLANEGPVYVVAALRICASYSTRLAPSIRAHLVRNAAHEGFCISLLESAGREPALHLVEAVQSPERLAVDDDEG